MIPKRTSQNPVRTETVPPGKVAGHEIICRTLGMLDVTSIVNRKKPNVPCIGDPRPQDRLSAGPDPTTIDQYQMGKARVAVIPQVGRDRFTIPVGLDYDLGKQGLFQRIVRAANNATESLK